MKTKELKNIVKAISKLKLDKCIIVDMSGVLIKDGYLHARNMECGVKIKIDWDGGDLFIDNAMWKKLTSNFKEFTTDMIGQDTVRLIADGAKISIPNVNIDNYPGGSSRKAEAFLVMDARESDVKAMIRGLDYVSKDELRPAMMQVALNEQHIVATDAHKLMYIKSEGEIYRNVLIRPEVIQMVNDLGWTDALIYADEKEIFVCNGADTIWFRAVDEKYPQWQQAIPSENPIKVEVERKKLIESIKQALVFANSTSKQVEFHLNGSAVLKSSDIDYKHEYENKFDGLYKHSGEDIKIGFNGGFLMDVLNDVVGDVATIELSTPNRAAIINGQVLLMPVMLNELS